MGALVLTVAATIPFSTVASDASAAEPEVKTITQAASPAPKCGEDKGHCYVTAQQKLETPYAHGIGGLFTEPRSLESIGAGNWTVGQLSLRSRGLLLNKYIEYGWMVSPRNYHDSRPHLFITLRFYPELGACTIGIPNLDPNKGERACPDGVYVARPASRRIGDAVGDRNGPQLYHLGYYTGNKAWWVQYGNEWLGYVNESYFGGAGFAKGNDLEWFGELAFDSGSCQPMGNGRYASDPRSASISGMFYETIEHETSVVKPAGAHLLPPNDDRFWNADKISRNTIGIDGFHYGGPFGGPNGCGAR